MNKFFEFLESGQGAWPQLFADPNIQNSVVKYLEEDYGEFHNGHIPEAITLNVIKLFFSSESPRIQFWYQNRTIWDRVRRIFIKDFEEYLNENN